MTADTDTLQERDDLSSLILNKMERVLETDVGSLNTELVRSYLDQGGNVNFETAQKDTLLRRACRQGNSELVGLLLKRGADVTIRNGQGKVAMAALIMGSDADGGIINKDYADCIRLMFEAGADKTLSPGIAERFKGMLNCWNEKHS